MDNARVYLSVSDNPARKTKYDLVSVEKVTDRGVLMINMDSQIPNDAVAEWLPVSGLFSKSAVIRREYTFGKSRFDFFVQDADKKAFIEVKGVTLENDGVVSFPDAPTERGVKHIEELISALERAALITEEKVAGSVRSHVRLEAEGNVLKISATSTAGSTYEELAVEHEGGDLVIAFNNRYLIDSLRSCTADRIRLSMTSALSSINIEPDDDDTASEDLFMLLPVRMKE